jgi:molybdopterin/thiamine biosynthesis adenylyltransferase/rhodanese-related sulfurtransferase
MEVVPKTYAELVKEALAIAGEVSPAELEEMRKTGPVVLIDCRENEEFATGIIAGASLVPRASIESAVARAGLNVDVPIVVYCSSGVRSLLAARTLRDMGYESATSLAGGLQRWFREGYPIERSRDGLTSDQRDRYARHLTLPEVGEEGQQKLLAAKVAVIGAGGLGSPAALYLAAPAVGTIGVIDHDVVDVSNLHRQILHGTDRIGRAKVDSAKQTLEVINPDVDVITFREQLNAANALDLLTGFDVIVDGSDSFPTRYLVNDASLHLRTPVAHGSIFRFDGQASFFIPYQGPCYRCVFAEAPPPELAPNCADAGVLGVLPGIIGSIQAAETIKYILGIGKTLQGRLLIYDALDQSFMSVTINRRSDCPACSDPARPPQLVDYDPYCRAR